MKDYTDNPEFEFKGDLMQVREMAVRAHGDQKYGKYDYGHHLDAVCAVLHRFGISATDDRNLHAAAYLHDTLEDTDMKHETIKDLGGRVYVLVLGVTDGSGETRSEKKESMYRLCSHTHDAVILKLADRIGNGEACFADGSELINLYRKEWPRMREALDLYACWGLFTDYKEEAKRMVHYLDTLFAHPHGR